MTQDLGVPGLEDAVEIGRGGFGVVYRASEPAMGRDVAVKVLPTIDDDAAKRFEQECRAAGSVADHPHIVSVYGAGMAPDGRRYLTMQLLAGGSLAKRVAADGPLEWPAAVEIAVKLAGALETAHRAGIVHRDVKPGNVLLSAQGEPALADFGIARLRDASTTTTGSVTATVEHAAPEVISGGRGGPAADVYSLASTIFMAITSDAPFARSSDESVAPMMMRILQEPPPDLRPQGLPAPIADVLERGLAKDPSARYLSAEAFGKALQDAQQQAGLVPTPMLVHGDASAAVQQADFSTVGDDEGLTQHRMRPAAPVPPPVVEAPVADKTKRNKLLVGAAGLMVVVLIAGFLATRGGGDDERAAAPKVAADPESVTLDLGLIKARSSALQIRREWTLAGDKGKDFSSVVTITNAGDQPIAVHDEVVPKEIAKSALDIEFEPIFTEVIEDDPIVRYQVDLAPGASFGFEYRVEVAADGVSEKRLRRFERALLIAQNAYDKVPEDTPPEVLEAGGVEVVGGDGGTVLASGGGAGADDDGVFAPSSGEIVDPGGSTASAGDLAPSANSSDVGSSSRDAPAAPVPGLDPAAPAPTPPPAPTGVTCTAGQRSMGITWNAVSSAEFYRIYDGGSRGARDERTTTNVAISGLEPNTTPTFDITAVNDAGLESGRGSCSARIPLPPPPAAPSSVTATANENDRVPLSWPSVPAAVKYNVYKSSGERINTVLETGFTVVDPALLPCEAVTYSVSAIDEFGQESPKRASAVVKTGQAGPPTGRDATIQLRNNSLITVDAGLHTRVSDPDGAQDRRLFVLVNKDFEDAKFSFQWSADGNFQIKAPAGFTDVRKVQFKVRDRCNQETAVLTLTMDFFTQG